MKDLSLDLRERIVAAVRQGQNQSEVARRFAVSSSTVSRYMAHSRHRGTLAPKPPPGAKRKIPEAVAAALSERLVQRPDASIAECQAWLAQAHGVNVSSATVHRAVRRSGFTHKKRASSPPSATTGGAEPGAKRSRE